MDIAKGSIIGTPEEDRSITHIREMAVLLDAELDEGNDASTITMNNHKAKGFISSYRILSGLSVWIYKITFFSEIKFNWGLSEESRYSFWHNVKGHFFHQFGNQEKFVEILQNQNLIFIGSHQHSVQTVFPANVNLKIALIAVDLKLLGHLDIRNAKRIYSKVENVFQNIPKRRPYRYVGGVDLLTKKYASIVCDNNGGDLVGGLLSEGAVLNMLASQIQEFRESVEKRIPKSSLSTSELSRLTYLGDYVTKDFEVRWTIFDLGKHFRMSPKKLQMGIKHLYGKSVGQYISSLRMEHAKHLLNTTDLNITEIRDQVGISSGSYFAKEFKNRYGKLPSQYRE